MAHTLYRIKSKLVNTPHLIDSTAFEAVMDYVNKRCEGNMDVAPKAEEGFSAYSTLHYAESDLGVIHIAGPLTNKTTGWEAFCGGTSYESIKEDFEALIEAGSKTIAFMVESGGGEAYGMMDTGNYLRKLADDNGVKIVSYVDGLSASAAYGLTVISDEIISNKNSEIGSIGVLIRLMNDSKALEKEGYERTFISAGSQKIPFSADGSFRKEFLEDLQYKVDSLYKDFTEYVAEHRNISVEAVRNTQANTFLAEDAIALGLADRIMTQEEFYSYLSGTAQNNKEGSSVNPRILKFQSKEETTEMTQLADLQAQLQAKDAELSALTQKVEAFASMETLFAEAQTALAIKDAELAAALDQVQTMQTQAKEAKELARKDKLAAVMAADKVEGVAASLAALDDTAFEVVLSSFSAQAKVVAESDLFTEMGAQGVEAEATVTPTTKPSSLDDVIKARLQNR